MSYKQLGVSVKQKNKYFKELQYPISELKYYCCIRTYIVSTVRRWTSNCSFNIQGMGDLTNALIMFVLCNISKLLFYLIIT